MPKLFKNEIFNLFLFTYSVKCPFGYPATNLLVWQFWVPMYQYYLRVKLDPSVFLLAMAVWVVQRRLSQKLLMFIKQFCVDVHYDLVYAKLTLLMWQYFEWGVKCFFSMGAFNLMEIGPSVFNLFRQRNFSIIFVQ